MSLEQILKSAKESQPDTLAEGYVWGAILSKTFACRKKTEPLPCLYVRSYVREGRRPYMICYADQTSLEGLYLLDLDRLHSVIRQERQDCVTFLYQFSQRHKILTDQKPVRARKYVFVCQPDDAKKWDAVLKTKADPKELRKRQRLKRKLKKAMVGKTSRLKNKLGLRKKGQEFELEASKSLKSYQERGSQSAATENTDGCQPNLEFLVSVRMSHGTQPVQAQSSVSPDANQEESEKNTSAEMTPQSAPILNVEIQSPENGRSDIVAEDDERLSGQQAVERTITPQSIPVLVKKETIDFIVEEDENEESSESSDDMDLVVDDNQSLDEIQKQLSRVEEEAAAEQRLKKEEKADENDQSGASPNTEVEPEPVEAKPAKEYGQPPWDNFDELASASEELRFKTPPSIEEFEIIRHCERMIDEQKMESENWEVALETTAPKATMWRKRLPATVSVTLLNAGRFVEIDAPPEVVYLMIGHPVERRKWDSNIKELRSVESNEVFGVELSVMDTVMGITTREFLKYRMYQAKFGEYPYMMVLRSCERDDVPVGKNNIRAVSVFNGYIFRPDKTDPNKTQMSIMANTDLKGLIPTWLINGFSSRIPPKFISNLEAASKKYVKEHKIKPGDDLSWVLNREF